MNGFCEYEMILPFIFAESVVKKLEVLVNIFIVAPTATEWLACGWVNNYVERLSIGTELVALQVAPLGSYGAQGLDVALFVSHLERLL